MGNCWAFLHRRGDNDDFTRLENLPNDPGRAANSASAGAGNRRRHQNHSRTSSASSAVSSTSDGSSSGRASRRQKNLQTSSYVNQLYMNSAFGPGDESSSMETKTVDEKRKARVRGLLEQIPVDMYTEGGKSAPECAICMGDFEEGDPIRFLPCVHSYHLQCIDDWLLRSFTCPSCMEPVDSALLSVFTVNTSTDLNALTTAAAAGDSSSPWRQPSKAQKDGE
uniref:RING-type domain-containing protein n=1 Tax=Globodera rostochiensis TaxID=31243 RepID=A0A914HAC8_GLORO